MDDPKRAPRLPVWRRNTLGHDLTPKLPEELRDIHRRVRGDLGDGARLSAGFFIINCLATVVACYGLLADSTAVVIGAMLIATLLGPIAGIALGLVDGNAPLLRTALLSESLGVLAVVALATIVGGIHHDIPATAEMLSRTKPNLLDLVIALAGGAAMAYALVSTNLSAGVVGVAIATALVPPLSSCGLLLARGEWSLAGGAFLLFFTNLVAIESAVSLVLWLYGFRRAIRDSSDAKVFVRTKIFSIGLLLLLGIFLYVNLSRAIDKNQYQARVRKSLDASLSINPGRFLKEIAFEESKDGPTANAVVYTPVSLTPEDVILLESRLPRHNDVPLTLTITSIIVKETSRTGYLHLSEKPKENPKDPVKPEPPRNPESDNFIGPRLPN